MAITLPKQPVYPPGPLGQTDLRSWRLDSSDSGRHIWHYIRSPTSAHSSSYEQIWGNDTARVREGPQTEEAQYWLGLDLPPAAPLADPRGNPFEAARNGYEFYKRLQSPDGHWSGEYGGPMFLLPGMVITCYVTKTAIPQEWKIEITRYLANMQRTGGEDDQGWGIHIEAKSSVFGTGLNYATMRLLGVDAEEPCMVRARATLHALGGCVGIPSWGKFWLAILNVHEWSGLNPTPSELWLLPEFVPFHPGRWWPHSRQVAIPQAYLSGVKFKAELDPLLLALRDELYTQPFNSIDWPSCRNKFAPGDLYSPHSSTADALFAVVNAYEHWAAPAFIRHPALRAVYKQVVMEDENTAYQTIGPVSKAMNMLVRYHADGPDSDAFRQHVLKLRDFMWMTPRGMLMCGTNGSQLWDAAFIAQALVETGLGNLPENKPSTRRLLEWLDDCQIRTNPKHYKQAYRHRTTGAWPFSTKEQGYTVSDCTAEGMKAVMMLQSLDGSAELVSEQRLCEAVDTILSLPNPDGGFASYELIRGPQWLELLNPAEVFANIMIEYTYPECTTACVTALSLFKKRFPDYRRRDIERVSKAAISFIHSSQRADGSWYGSWGICFTYATMFAIESLSLAGEDYDNSHAVKKACDFLLARQERDGGWGESFKSCETEQYVHNETSQVTNTAWAVITLITARYPDRDPIRRGAQLIMQRQLGDGSWAQESIEGIFNKNAAISYPNFKFAWTINALGQAWKYVGKEGW